MKKERLVYLGQARTEQLAKEMAEASQGSMRHSQKLNRSSDLVHYPEGDLNSQKKNDWRGLVEGSWLSSGSLMRLSEEADIHKGLRNSGPVCEMVVLLWACVVLGMASFSCFRRGYG